MTIRAVTALGLAVLAAASVQGARAQTRPADAPPPAADGGLVAEGRSLYRAACAPCHGVLGDGRGPAARRMDPPPRDFTTGAFKFRSTASGGLPTEQDLFRVISRGVPGTWMPAWEELLGERQRWAVVTHLRSLVPGMEDAEPPLDLPGEPPIGGSPREGRWVYLALGCSKCHGGSGRGDGPSARGMIDDAGRPTTPVNLTHAPLKGGSRPLDIYRTLRTGLNGTPMPAYEPEAVLFAGGRGVDVSLLAPGASPSEQAGLAEYLMSEPDRDAIAALSDSARSALIEHRLWSLVAYVRSLARPRGALHRFFVDDPNATSSPRSR